MFNQQSQVSNILITLSLGLVLFISPLDVLAASAPSLGSNSVLSSAGAAIVSGWNYLKIDNAPSQTCSVQTIMDEIQAAGGSTLLLDSLFVSSDGGNSFKEYQPSSPDSLNTKVSSTQIIAFSSNQKLFFNLTPERCTGNTGNNPADQDRISQISQIRQQSHNQDGGNILAQLASVPQAFWQQILGIFSPSPKPTIPNISNTSDKIEVEKLTTSSLFVSKQLSVGLLSLEPIGASISAQTTLKIQPDSTLGGVDFLSGKVTIDKDGTLNITKLAAPSTIAGSSLLPAGQTKITINNPLVTNNSKIFLTPTSPTDKVLAATNILPNKSFDVVITSSSGFDINFNWWIVETE